MLLHTVVDYLPSLQTGVQNCKQTKSVNKFGTENNFILDYLSESSRQKVNILSKWVWKFSPYPQYTTTWYNKPVSCSQIAMSPQNILSVCSVSSASVVILIWRLYRTSSLWRAATSKTSSSKSMVQKSWKETKEYRWETIYIVFRYNTSLHSDTFFVS